MALYKKSGESVGNPSTRFCSPSNICVTRPTNHWDMILLDGFKSRVDVGCKWSRWIPVSPARTWRREAIHILILGCEFFSRGIGYDAADWVTRGDMNQLGPRGNKRAWGSFGLGAADAYGQNCFYVRRQPFTSTVFLQLSIFSGRTTSCLIFSIFRLSREIHHLAEVFV